MKSKKWLWGLLSLIVLIVAGFGIYEGYSYFHPNVYLSYRVQEGEDLYLSLPSYAIETTSRFGYAPKYDEEMKEWWLVTNEMEVRLHTDYVKPINVSSEVLFEDGNTIITYSGTATLPSGETETIDERFVLDFQASDQLP